MKFKYWDEVKVIEGFYKGLKGFVTNYHYNEGQSKYYYEVKIEEVIGCMFHQLEVEIREDYLEKIQ